MIRKAESRDLPRLTEIIQGALQSMRAENNDQWDSSYPNAEILAEDIRQGWLYVEERDGTARGFSCINGVEPEEYASAAWTHPGPCLVLHRTAIAPEARRQGICAAFFRLAEDLALQNGIAALRSDTYSLNSGMNQLFLRAGYTFAGHIRFPGRQKPFHCYEKRLER